MLNQTIFLHIQLNHPVWINPFFYLFIGSSIIYMITYFFKCKQFLNKTNETKLLQQQHVAKLDMVRKDHLEILEKIRIEMLKKEEERSRQWIESEKETLHVLNGVSILLDLNDKMGRVESEKILLVLDEIRNKIENITPIN